MFYYIGPKRQDRLLLGVAYADVLFYVWQLRMSKRRRSLIALHSAPLPAAHTHSHHHHSDTQGRLVLPLLLFSHLSPLCASPS